MAAKSNKEWPDIIGLSVDIIDGPRSDDLGDVFTSLDVECHFEIRKPDLTGKGILVTMRFSELRRTSPLQDAVVSHPEYAVSFKGFCTISIPELQINVLILAEGEYDSGTQTGVLKLDRSAKIEIWQGVLADKKEGACA